MPFFVQGVLDDHMLTAATDTAKKAFAETIEWHIVKGFNYVTIWRWGAKLLDRRICVGDGAARDCGDGYECIRHAVTLA